MPRNRNNNSSAISIPVPADLAMTTLSMHGTYPCTRLNSTDRDRTRNNRTTFHASISFATNADVVEFANNKRRAALL